VGTLTDAATGIKVTGVVGYIGIIVTGYATYIGMAVTGYPGREGDGEKDPSVGAGVIGALSGAGVTGAATGAGVVRTGAGVMGALTGAGVIGVAAGAGAEGTPPPTLEQPHVVAIVTSASNASHSD
jgi:hypothetical protein